MEKTDVAYFSTLLNETAEDVEKYSNEGTLSEKVKALNLMDSDQVTTLKTNLTKEVKDNHISELVDEAKKGNLDKDLYKVIKGATLEMTEKDLAKQHGVESYDGINDLVLKAINKNKGQKDDTKTQELTQKVTDLQGVNENLVKEKDDAVKAAKNEYEGKILSRDKKDYIDKIPFDFSDVEQSDLEKITGQRKQIVTSVFDSKFNLVFQGDSVVVQDKENNLVKNPATLEPVPVLDVLKQIPVELGIKLKSPEAGGQGGSSSGGNGSAKFKSVEEFGEYCEAQNIKPNSSEGIKVWAERRPQ